MIIGYQVKKGTKAIRYEYKNLHDYCHEEQESRKSWHKLPNGLVFDKDNFCSHEYDFHKFSYTNANGSFTSYLIESDGVKWIVDNEVNIV